MDPDRPRRPEAAGIAPALDAPPLTIARWHRDVHRGRRQRGMHREGHALRRVGSPRVAMVNVGAVAVLVAGCTGRPRASAPPAVDAGGAAERGLTVAAPAAASGTDPGESGADVPTAPSSTPGEPSSPESSEPLDAPTPSNRMPPCRQYYPACGTFSTPGRLARHPVRVLPRRDLQQGWSDGQVRPEAPMVGTFVVLAWLVRTSAAVADVSLATPLPRSVHRRRVHRRSRCVGRGRVERSAVHRRTHSLWSPLPDACLELIDTDRPHQTDTPHVVPAGHLDRVGHRLAAARAGRERPWRPGGAHVLLFDNEYSFGLVSHVNLQILDRHVDYVPGTKTFGPPATSASSSTPTQPGGTSRSGRAPCWPSRETRRSTSARTSA